MTLAIAHERIVCHREQTLRWLREESNIIPHASCVSQPSCLRQLQKTERAVMRRPNFTHVLSELTMLSSGLCDVCTGVAEAVNRTNLEKTWKLLPTFFGLPEWKDLKDLD
jgi:hypothetical protein